MGKHWLLVQLGKYSVWLAVMRPSKLPRVCRHGINSWALTSPSQHGTWQPLAPHQIGCHNCDRPASFSEDIPWFPRISGMVTKECSSTIHNYGRYNYGATSRFYWRCYKNRLTYSLKLRAMNGVLKCSEATISQKSPQGNQRQVTVTQTNAVTTSLNVALIAHKTLLLELSMLFLSFLLTYGPHKAVAEVSNHNEPIGRKSGIQLVRKIRKSMGFTFSCFVSNWLTD